MVIGQDAYACIRNHKFNDSRKSRLSVASVIGVRDGKRPVIFGETRR